LIGGQIDTGFVITGFYEDRYPPDKDPLAEYMSTFVATRALKGIEDRLMPDLRILPNEGLRSWSSYRLFPSKARSSSEHR
jgi:hypothetical protein